MKMTMKISKKEYEKILQNFAPSTLFDIRRVCSVLIMDELEQRLEIDRNILSVEDIAASAIPDKRLEVILKRMMNDLHILKKTPINKKLLEGGYKQLKVNKENTLILSQVTDELGKPHTTLWKITKEIQNTKTHKHENLWQEKERGIIHYNGKTCTIPFKSYEYYLLQTILKYPIDKRITETTILEVFDREKCKADTERAVYDAHARLNKRLLIKFNIKEYIGYEKSNYWRTQ